MTVEINLIPLKTRQQKWGKLAVIIGTILFVLILASILYVYFDKVHQRNEAEKTLSSLQENLQVLNKKDSLHSQKRLQLNSEVSTLKDNASHTEALLMTFVELLPKGGTVLNFDYQNNIITLTGQFNGLGEVAGFSNALKTSKLVESVKLGDVNQASKKDYTANFTINLNQAAYKALGGQGK